jgi:hypothetical protein
MEVRWMVWEIQEATIRSLYIVLSFYILLQRPHEGGIIGVDPPLFRTTDSYELDKIPESDCTDRYFS